MKLKKLAIKVEQQFGSFYVAKFKASELLNLAYSEPLRKEGGALRGNQRLISEKRRKEIRNYINSSDCAFPSSIILAANFSKEGNGQVEQDENLKWDVVEEDSTHYLVIPTLNPMAVIIDGQHRVLGFKDANPKTTDMELICSVYLDLPSSLQAFLFATINSTQKAVSKSQAYELFGYDLENESPETWSPDKLAISLCRKLNSDHHSPFYEHIKPGAISDFTTVGGQQWLVSTACIVDCILRLITSKPLEDKSSLYRFGDKSRIRTKLREERKDNSPLRYLYINNHDGVIYNIVRNFFNAAKTVYNFSFEGGTALTKTIGIQGFFDVLKEYIKYQKEDSLKDMDFTEEAFMNIFKKSQKVDFTNDIFMKFSGVGRTRVRDIILVAAGLKEVDNIPNEDFKKWALENI